MTPEERAEEILRGSWHVSLTASLATIRKDIIAHIRLAVAEERAACADECIEEGQEGNCKNHCHGADAHRIKARTN